jgi:hypothetical protein
VLVIIFVFFQNSIAVSEMLEQSSAQYVIYEILNFIQLNNGDVAKLWIIGQSGNCVSRNINYH